MNIYSTQNFMPGASNTPQGYQQEQFIVWHDPNANQNHRRGLLIDYDYAEKLDSEGSFSLGTRTVSFITTCTPTLS
jgi:hypothetical protein